MDLIKSALELAKEKHSHQSYRGGPGSYFKNHVVKVYEKAKQYTHSPSVLAASILHDVVEDSDVSLEEVKSEFGNEVADLVWRVTDEPGANRKERKAKTYPKIRKNKNAILIKLCDRYVNMYKSEKIKMYQYEYSDFRDALYIPGQWDNLWNELDYLAGYEQRKAA